jgi:hypothetical protein
MTTAFFTLSPHKSCITSQLSVIIIFSAASPPVPIGFLLMMRLAKRHQVVVFVSQLGMLSDRLDVVDLFCGVAASGPLAAGIVGEFDFAQLPPFSGGAGVGGRGPGGWAARAALAVGDASPAILADSWGCVRHVNPSW